MDFGVVSIDVRKYSYLREPLMVNASDLSPTSTTTTGGGGAVDLMQLLQTSSSSSYPLSANRKTQNWIHLPYRNNISIHFIPLLQSASNGTAEGNGNNFTAPVPNCKIKLYWKATVLEELNVTEMYAQFKATPLMVIARKPAIGVKYLVKGPTFGQEPAEGLSLSRFRFQISFNSDQEYDQCLSVFKRFGFYIKNYDHGSGGHIETAGLSQLSTGAGYMQQQQYHQSFPMPTQTTESSFRLQILGLKLLTMRAVHLTRESHIESESAFQNQGQNQKQTKTQYSFN